MSAAALGTDRAAMMTIVDRLEQPRLAPSRRSVTDRRRQELHIIMAARSVPSAAATSDLRRRQGLS